MADSRRSCSDPYITTNKGRLSRMEPSKRAAITSSQVPMGGDVDLPTLVAVAAAGNDSGALSIPCHLPSSPMPDANP